MEDVKIKGKGSPLDPGTPPPPYSQNPFDRANPISKLLFLWILPFLRLGANKNLTLPDLFPIRPADNAERLGVGLEKKWDEEIQLATKRKRKPRLAKALWSLFWPDYIWFALLQILNECTLAVALPILLRWFILSFGDENVTKRQQYMYAAAVCVTTLVNTLMTHIDYFGFYLLTMRCRVAVTALIYRKSLRLSSCGPNQASIGHILNLAANDVHRLDDAILHLPYLFIAPIQWTLFTYILLEEIGYPALAGVAMVTLMTPLQYFVGKYSGIFRLQAAERTDERARFMSEIINGIRVIKMYAWEEPFSNLIHRLRFLEMKSLKKLAYLLGFYTGFYIACLQPVILVTIVTYILTGNEISADKVFYAIAIFNTLLTTCMYFVPQTVIGISAARVTLNRLENYFGKDEQGKCSALMMQELNSSNPKPTIVMEHVSASWTGERETLQNLTLQLEGEKLVIVIGGVGSGKSSFLSTLIGELPIIGGSCLIQGSTSYCSQEAWIFTGTVRDNILFGQPYDDIRYNRVVDACALATDFKQFEFGDGSVVGERGITLSGGQKARVNLARALYRKADIYLLDDPLSAVDARVSKHIFDKCLKNLLRGHLRILVTHQVQYLPKADHIILLNQDGEVLAQGTFKELQSHNVDILSILKSEEEDESRRVSRTPSVSGVSMKKDEEEVTTLKYKTGGGQDEEAIEYGKVSWGIYRSYFGASKSNCATFWLFGGFLLVQFLLSGSYWWLSFWTNYEEETHRHGLVPLSSINGTLHTVPVDNKHTLVYLWIFVGFVVATLSSVILVTMGFFSFTMKVSVNIHDRMFKSLVRAPTKFYDTNPPGRILNRVTRDLSQMDVQLPEILYDTITISLRVIGTIIIVISSNYYVLLPTGVAFILFYLTRWYYVKTIRDVKRLEAISRSPVFTFLTSSYQGIATIRSCKSQELTKCTFDKHLNGNTAANFTYLATTRWFAIWLEITALAYFTAITFGFLIATTSSLAGSVGMAMASIMELNLYFQWGMRQATELENVMTSVERIQEYASVKSEAKLCSEPKLEKSWMGQGEIKFVNVSLAYDEKPVLRNLSFTIKGRERIGVVGRTGAGKSSIITALFRLTEPTGSILIDGVCVNEIGLHELRENISIIPQEPQLFSGTMRYNLDPFQKYEDEEIWRALGQVALKEVVTALDMPVADGGSNFSIGERQLVCLARAILRNNKILVMDEATANVDPKTDNFIQNTIRAKFSACTIITIAHRLQSVMDCDRILVLEQGELKEYDHPFALLQNPHGFLKSLIEQTGKSVQRTLTAIAEENYKSKSDDEFLDEEEKRINPD